MPRFQRVLTATLQLHPSVINAGKQSEEPVAVSGGRALG